MFTNPETLTFINSNTFSRIGSSLSLFGPPPVNVRKLIIKCYTTCNYIERDLYAICLLPVPKKFWLRRVLACFAFFFKFSQQFFRTVGSRGWMMDIALNSSAIFTQSSCLFFWVITSVFLHSIILKCSFTRSRRTVFSLLLKVGSLFLFDMSSKSVVQSRG